MAQEIEKEITQIRCDESSQKWERLNLQSTMACFHFKVLQSVQFSNNHRVKALPSSCHGSQNRKEKAEFTIILSVHVFTFLDLIQFNSIHTH